APPTPERPPKLWTGTIKAPPKGEFTGLTLSSDGHSLVTTSEEKVALWDLRTGKLVRERSGKEAAPDSPVFVSQDKEIAFEHDLAVHVVDRETLKIRTSLEKVGVGGISSLMASRDGAHLAGWRGDPGGLGRRPEEGAVAQGIRRETLLDLQGRILPGRQGAGARRLLGEGLGAPARRQDGAPAEASRR